MKLLHRCCLIGLFVSFLLLSSISAAATKTPEVDRIAQINDTKDDAGKLSLYFLHLGKAPSSKKSDHGDAELLISPDGKVMLVDCGAPAEASYVVDELQALGIDHIDYFVNSHPHHDHLGGFSAVADHFPIAVVLENTLEGYEAKYLTVMNERCAKDHIPQRTLCDGDSFSFGDFVRVDVYNPPKEITYDGTYDDGFVNNTSLALKFTYGESTVLLCGDLYMKGEQAVLDAHAADITDIDVAKANHHGLYTSNQLTWVRTVNPKYCVAVSDIASSLQVMNTYRKNGTKFRQTVSNGIVKFVMDDHDHITMICQHDGPMDN